MRTLPTALCTFLITLKNSYSDTTYCISFYPLCSMFFIKPITKRRLLTGDPRFSSVEFSQLLSISINLQLVQYSYFMFACGTVIFKHKNS